MSESIRSRRWLAVFALVCWTVISSASAGPAAAIATLMTTLAARGQFNGAILVAQGGNVIYRNAFGKSNFQTGADFTPETPSNIESLTKQFTAMAIMILSERKKLRYDDPVARYIPEFTGATHLSQVTLRYLLTRTSGIPDYGDLAIDDSGLSNRDSSPDEALNRCRVKD